MKKVRSWFFAEIKRPLFAILDLPQSSKISSKIIELKMSGKINISVDLRSIIWKAIKCAKFNIESRVLFKIVEQKK